MKALILVSILIVGVYSLVGVGLTGSFVFSSGNLYGALYDSQANFLFSRGVTWWGLPYGDVVKVNPHGQSILAVDSAGMIIGQGRIFDSTYELEISNYRQNFMIFVGEYDSYLPLADQAGKVFYCTSYDGRLLNFRSGRMYLNLYCDALLNTYAEWINWG